MYEYNAEVVRVYDGDTIRVNIDLGFGLSMNNAAIRLKGINTPELRGEDKEQVYISRDRLAAILSSANFKCRIKTTKGKERGKYGRILGEIYVGSDEKGWSNVNQQLLEEIGQILYQKRIKKKYSLEQISEITKISIKNLEFIEQGFFYKLPGKFYEKSF